MSIETQFLFIALLSTFSQGANMHNFCLIFGAGAIGKSVAGFAFSKVGYRPIFVDVSADVINDLNERKEYRIYESSESFSTVKEASCLNIKDLKAVIDLASQAEYICTSTGENGIEDVLYILSEANKIRKKRPLYVLFCENLKNIEKISKDFLDNPTGKFVGRLIPTSIERMAKIYISSKNQYDVIAEEFYPIIIGEEISKDSQLLNGHPKAFMPVSNLEAYYARKVCTNNLGHAVLGYMGYQKNYMNLTEAAQDLEIRSVLLMALNEAGKMLQIKYGFSEEEIGAHIDNLINIRYINNNLDDQINRVARDPARKLHRGERLIGTALSCMDCGIYPNAILETVEYAVKYDNKAEQATIELNALFRKGKVNKILTDICGLKHGEPLYNDLCIRLSK